MLWYNTFVINLPNGDYSPFGKKREFLWQKVPAQSIHPVSADQASQGVNVVTQRLAVVVVNRQS